MPSSPGVYVNEVSSGSAPIAGVGTSIAAFIGAVPSYVDAADLAPLYTPVLCTNFSEFKKRFGDFSDDESQRVLAHAVYGFFNNGGTRCYVIRAISSQDAVMNIEMILKILETIDEISIIAAPGLSATDLPIPSTVFEFDGNTYIELPLESLPASDGFTISFWACCHHFSNNCTFSAGIIIDDADDKRVVNLHLPANQPREICFDFVKSMEPLISFERISKEISSETYIDMWIHWAFTKNSSRVMSIYRNGELWHRDTMDSQCTLPSLVDLNTVEGGDYEDACTIKLGTIFNLNNYFYKLDF